MLKHLSPASLWPSLGLHGKLLKQLNLRVVEGVYEDLQCDLEKTCKGCRHCNPFLV